jgi:hypothetical protein
MAGLDLGMGFWCDVGGGVTRAGWCLESGGAEAEKDKPAIYREVSRPT